MELKCSHCLFIAKSLDLNKDNALAEIIITFSKHIITHKDIEKEMQRDIPRAISTIATILMIAKHTTLLDTNFDSDDYIQQEFSRLVDILEECLGVEVFDNKPEATNSLDKVVPDGVGSESEDASQNLLDLQTSPEPERHSAD